MTVDWVVGLVFQVNSIVAMIAAIQLCIMTPTARVVTTVSGVQVRADVITSVWRACLNCILIATIQCFGFVFIMTRLEAFALKGKVLYS